MQVVISAYVDNGTARLGQVRPAPRNARNVNSTGCNHRFQGDQHGNEQEDPCVLNLAGGIADVAAVVGKANRGGQ